MAFPDRLLMGPGPSNPYPEVVAAFTQPLLGHLDPEFLHILDETCDRLRTVFGTTNGLTLPISGTGSAGMEACFVNLVEPGDTVIVGVNGVFGDIMSYLQPRIGQFSNPNLIYQGYATGVAEGSSDSADAVKTFNNTLPYASQFLDAQSRYSGWYWNAAEGGTGWGHAVTMARARSLFGPYELHPDTYALTARDRPDAELQRTGHADLVETPSGETYMVFLCGRPLRNRGRCTLGRETAIQKMQWGADGWRACNAIDPEGNVVLLRERESAPDDDPTALEALETSLWREETRYDRAHIDRVLADDFVEIGRSGRVWTREAITSLPRAPIDAVLPLPGFSVRRLGQDIALATYESRVQREGAFERAHRCSLWSRTDGRWRLRFHQATPTAEP